MFKKLTLLVTLMLLSAGCDVAPDKRFHIQGGALVSGTTYAATKDPKKSILAAAVVGVAKEVYDSTGRGNVEALDIAATVAGGILTVIVLESLPEKPNNEPASMEYNAWLNSIGE